MAGARRTSGTDQRFVNSPAPAAGRHDAGDSRRRHAPPRPHRRRLWIGSIVGGCLIALIGYAALRLPAYRPAALLARYWQGQLPSIPDELVATHLEQIAELGEPGIEVLVESLGSSRPTVVDAAALALDRQLKRWQRLPARQSAGRITHLARELAARVERWPARAQSAASDLARRILAWPTDTRSVGGGQAVADCERVLRAYGPQLAARGAPAAARADAGTGPAANAGRSAQVDPVPEGNIGLAVSRLPGGDLPVDAVELPPLPPSLADPPQPRSVNEDEPDLVPPFGKRLPHVLFPENEGPPREPEPALPIPEQPRELDPELRNRPVVRPLAPTALTEPARPLESLTDLELIGHLQDRDIRVAETCATLLSRRGFGKAEMEIAVKMASPDAETRRRLAETLARQPVAAGRWLVWLSYDDDAEVRRTVVSLMATAQDPLVRRRLAEMESSELDERVREQLQKWRQAEAATRRSSRLRR